MGWGGAKGRTANPEIQLAFVYVQEDEGPVGTPADEKMGAWGLNVNPEKIWGSVSARRDIIGIWAEVPTMGKK